MKDDDDDDDDTEQERQSHVAKSIHPPRHPQWSLWLCDEVMKSKAS